MKILHFADLHLGVELYGRLNQETGLNTRLEDFLASLDRLVEYALESRVDLVIFCGDAYKNREPTQTQQREFARRIRRLSESNIPVFLLVGNHDLPTAFGRATSTEIFDTLGVKNVYVSNKPEIYRIVTPSGALQIASLPWLRRNTLYTRDEIKGLSIEQVNRKISEKLTSIVAYHASRVDPEIPAILAAHITVTGAKLGSERSMSLGNEPSVLASNLANHAFDYIALGHIHRHQVMHPDPPVVYSGSLDRIDFGEEEDEKGFYEIEIKKGSGSKYDVSYNFHPIEGRRFLTIRIAIPQDEDDPQGLILKEIARYPLKGSIVRLQISLPFQVNMNLDERFMYEALKDAFYSMVSKEVSQESRTRLSRFSSSALTPLEALRAYLEIKNVSPDRVKLLMEYGEKLITGPENSD